jgi:hypothetical protein
MSQVSLSRREYTRCGKECHHLVKAFFESPISRNSLGEARGRQPTRVARLGLSDERRAPGQAGDEAARYSIHSAFAPFREVAGGPCGVVAGLRFDGYSHAGPV